MSDLEETAARFRRDLLARDARTAAELVRTYGDVWLSLRRDLTQLENAISEARKAGRSVGIGWLYREDRFKRLLAQAEQRLAAFAQYATPVVDAQIRRAIDQGRQDALTLTQAAGLASVTVPFTTLGTLAIEQMAAHLQLGSPLRSLLDALGPDLSARLRHALVLGIGQGKNPRVTAHLMRQAAQEQAGVSLTRALTIARTETLRAYRESTRLTWQQADVVPLWRWLSARSLRTCAFCWAMDGTVHRVTEPMATHPNCRCVMVPLTATAKGWQMGADVFAKLGQDKQRRILGHAKYEAWADRKITLDDLVRFDESKTWGRTGHEASLRDALARR